MSRNSEHCACSPLDSTSVRPQDDAATATELCESRGAALRALVFDDGSGAALASATAAALELAADDGRAALPRACDAHLEGFPLSTVADIVATEVEADDADALVLSPMGALWDRFLELVVTLGGSERRRLQYTGRGATTITGTLKGPPVRLSVARDRRTIAIRGLGSPTASSRLWAHYGPIFVAQVRCSAAQRESGPCPPWRVGYGGARYQLKWPDGRRLRAPPLDESTAAARALAAPFGHALLDRALSLASQRPTLEISLTLAVAPAASPEEAPGAVALTGVATPQAEHAMMKAVTWGSRGVVQRSVRGVAIEGFELDGVFVLADAAATCAPHDADAAVACGAGWWTISASAGAQEPSPAALRTYESAAEAEAAEARRYWTSVLGDGVAADAAAADAAAVTADDAQRESDEEPAADDDVHHHGAGCAFVAMMTLCILSWGIGLALRIMRATMTGAHMSPRSQAQSRTPVKLSIPTAAESESVKATSLGRAAAPLLPQP